MALVYIVEDDRNIREIETFALRNTGYEVMGFECAKDFYKEMEIGNRILSCWTLCFRMKTGWKL